MSSELGLCFVMWLSPGCEGHFQPNSDTNANHHTWHMLKALCNFLVSKTEMMSPKEFYMQTPSADDEIAADEFSCDHSSA